MKGCAMNLWCVLVTLLIKKVSFASAAADGEVSFFDEPSQHNQQLFDKQLLRDLEDASSLIDANLIVDFFGFPELVTKEDIELLEETLKEAYDCIGPASYHKFTLVKLLVTDQPVNNTTTFNQTYNSMTEEAFLAESFSLITQVQVDRNIDANHLEEEDRVFNYTEKTQQPSITNTLSNMGLKDSTPVEICLLPTSDEVAALWTDLILEAGVSSILSVSSISEMEPADCSDNIGNFTTYLVLDIETFVGEIDEDTIRSLEDHCVEVYNSVNTLNGKTCDPNFRVMDSAQVESINRNGHLPASPDYASDTSRRLEENDLNATLVPTSSPSQTPSWSPSASPTIRGPNFMSIMMSITGSCRGCVSDQRFFDFVNVRRLEEEIFLSNDASMTPRSLVGVSGSFLEDCFCPVNAMEFRGPTAEEFFVALETKVADSHPQEVLDLISSLSNVKEESCLRDDEFTFYLDLQLLGDQGILAGSEHLVEEIVLATFNQNAEETCDPYGRAATSVALLEIERRHLRRGLEDNANNSLSPTIMGNETETSRSPSQSPSQFPTASPSSSPTIRGPSLFSLSLKITGACSGCRQEIDLFDDINVRRKLEDLNDLSSQSEKKCTCLDSSLNESGQTSLDFLMTFNRLLNQSSIPDLGTALHVKSFNDESSPSPVPTMHPTLIPSEQPSNFPSMVPSPGPSDNPSDNPSLRPSPFPSCTPSANPTDYFCENSILLQEVTEDDNGAIELLLDDGSTVIKAGVGNPQNLDEERLIVEGKCQDLKRKFLVGDAVFEAPMDENNTPFSHMGVNFKCADITYITVYEGCHSRGDMACYGASTSAKRIPAGEICSDIPDYVDNKSDRWFVFPINPDVRRYYLKFYFTAPPPTSRPTQAPAGQCDPYYNENGRVLELNAEDGFDSSTSLEGVFPSIKYISHYSSNIYLLELPPSFDQVHTLNIILPVNNFDDNTAFLLVEFNCECFSGLWVYHENPVNGREEFDGGISCSRNWSYNFARFPLKEYRVSDNVGESTRLLPTQYKLRMTR
jgi:hypothetical protein